MHSWVTTIIQVVEDNYYKRKSIAKRPWVTAALDVFFPRYCPGCALVLPAHGTGCCEDCANRVKLNTNFFCIMCQARLPTSTKICHRDSPCVVAAATSYDELLIEKLVKQLKFENIWDAAAPLASFVVSYIKNFERDFPPHGIIVPIPLSASRRRARVYNQAEVIGQLIAHATMMDYAPRLLRRVVDSAPQTECASRAARHTNVQDIFRARFDEALRDRPILLLDDVVTTGATLHSAAKALHEAGYKKIIALAVARA